MYFTETEGKEMKLTFKYVLNYYLFSVTFASHRFNKFVFQIVKFYIVNIRVNV